MMVGMYESIALLERAGRSITEAVEIIRETLADRPDVLEFAEDILIPSLLACVETERLFAGDEPDDIRSLIEQIREGASELVA